MFAPSGRCIATCRSTLKIPSIGRSEEGTSEGFDIILKLYKIPKLITKQNKTTLPKKLRTNLFLKSLRFALDEVSPTCVEKA